jgi:hypothetical protein
VHHSQHLEPPLCVLQNGKPAADVCCIHANKTNQANKGAILAALAAAAAAVKVGPAHESLIGGCAGGNVEPMAQTPCWLNHTPYLLP